jgi:hypothetical protein
MVIGISLQSLRLKLTPPVCVIGPANGLSRRKYVDERLLDQLEQEGLLGKPAEKTKRSFERFTPKLSRALFRRRFAAPRLET